MSSLKSRKRTERITNALCFIALIFLTCLCMLPIWWIFRSSLMSNAELFKWPPAFSRGNAVGEGLDLAARAGLAADGLPSSRRAGCSRTTPTRWNTSSSGPI